MAERYVHLDDVLAASDDRYKDAVDNVTIHCKLLAVRNMLNKINENLANPTVNDIDAAIIRLTRVKTLMDSI